MLNFYFITLRIGSLYDLLATNLDLAFDMKLCLTKDLIHGMVYINKSPIGYHGRLSSKNCLIDGHFKLKIADIETTLLRAAKSGHIFKRIQSKIP